MASKTDANPPLKAQKLLFVFAMLITQLVGLSMSQAVSGQSASPVVDVPLEATGTYLDEIEKRQFLTSFHPTVSVYARRHGQNQWSLTKSKDFRDNVYIERLGDGTFEIFTVENIKTVKAEGFVGKKGLYVCRKQSCDYWLSNNDGKIFIITVLRNGVAGNAGYTAIDLQELVDAKRSDAATMVKVWQAVETNPTAQFVSTRRSADAILGFSLQDIDKHIGVPVPAAAQPAPVIAAAPAPTAVIPEAKAQPRASAALSPVAQPLASSQPPAQLATNASPSLVDPKLLVKQWGALASLNDTIWAEGQDQLVDFVWAEPGSRMTITIQGLWGRRVVTVSPSANPKLMAARVSFTDTGDTAEGTLAPTAAGYVLTAGGTRETCTKNKATLNCVIETQLPNGKYSFDAGHLFRPTDYAGAQALLTKLTQVFPLRPAGKYDPLGGMFAGIDRAYRFDDGSQILLEEWTNPSGYRGLTYGLLGPDGDYRDYRSYARLKGYPDSAYSLRAEVFAGTTFRTKLTGVSRPARMLHGGRFMFELNDGSIWILSLSLDKQALLSQIATRQGKGWSITSASMATSPGGPADIREWGAVGKLAGKLWSRTNLFEGYQWIDEKRLLRRVWTNDYMEIPYVISYCVIQKINSRQLECKGQGQSGEINSVYTLNGESSFDFNGLRYNLKQESAGLKSTEIFIATRIGDGTPTSVFLRGGSSWASLAAAGRQGFDRRRSRELAMQAREESAAKEREAAMWRGAIAAVFGNSGGNAPNPLFEPSPVFVSPSGPELPGMGRRIYVPPSRMTPQEQARWDELERFKMAEQRRRGETPTTFADDARSATGSSPASSGAAISGSSSASSSDTARQASRPTPEPPRPAPRPLEVVLTVVPSVSEKDKTQPLCISTVMTLGNWPEGYNKTLIVKDMARQHFARFVSACRNARGDLRSALPETVNFVTNESADTDLRAYIDQARAAHKTSSWLVPM